MVQENLGPHYNKISIFGYVFLCLNFLLFDYLLVVDRDLYSMLTREDSYVEYTGCFLLFLIGGLLFLTGSLRPNKKKEAIVPQWLYLIFACAFIWAAGEEISWGQRLFGFETPEFLRTVNTQNEFNIHNIEKKFFDRLYDRSTVILYLTTSIAFFFNKRIFFRVPLPSILLMYCFILILSYRAHARFWHLDAFHIGYPVLLVFAIYALFSKQGILAIVSVATMTLILINTLFNHYFHHQFIGQNSANEVREYLFSFVSFLYACELFHARKKALLQFDKSVETQ